MKRIIRLFGRSSNKPSTNQPQISRTVDEQLDAGLQAPKTIVETKIIKVRNLLNDHDLIEDQIGELLQLIDSLINMDALRTFYETDRKTFKKAVKFLEKAAADETNPEYMNARMTLVSLKYFLGEKKAFLKFLEQLEKRQRYHNEASMLRIAIDHGWTPDQGRIIVNCIVKCQNCGKERKIERMVSPTQIKEFYLDACDSCGGTEYQLMDVNGQSILRWTRS